jgi:endo-1,4-beta-xylanase
MRMRRILVATALTVGVVVAATGTLAGDARTRVGPVTAAPAVTATASDLATTALRRLAQHTRLRIGTAVDMTALAEDATYRRMLGEQFSTVTPENVMKWEVVEPQPGRYDFSAADQLVRFALAHGQKVRGHTLVWHNQLPSWLSSGTWTPADVRNILRAHIVAEVGHFRGRIWAWDVVNEAVDDTGGLRDTIWSKALGESYIADAFRWAHQTDPKAILFYNDYGIEGVNAKSTAVYDLIRRLRAEEVPIQAVGVQGHLSTRYPVPIDMPQNLRRFSALGLDTAVTEADVRSVLPVGPAEVAAQAQAFSLMLQSCLLVRSCISYTLWGFTDKYDWVPAVFTGEGYATPFDAGFNAKPAGDAMRRDLALAPSLPSRGIVAAGD